jgi:hypothetical protein
VVHCVRGYVMWLFSEKLYGVFDVDDYCIYEQGVSL